MSDYEGEEVPPAPPVRFIKNDQRKDVVSSTSSYSYVNKLLVLNVLIPGIERVHSITAN